MFERRRHSSKWKTVEYYQVSIIQWFEKMKLNSDSAHIFASEFSSGYSTDEPETTSTDWSTWAATLWFSE